MMKRFLSLLLVICFALASCGPKPMYKTKSGKKKLKHYNQLQYGDPRAK